MNTEDLLKFKQIARRLHTRGLISQNLCLSILGLKKPKYCIQSWFISVGFSLCKFALKHSK